MRVIEDVDGSAGLGRCNSSIEFCAGELELGNPLAELELDASR